MIFDIRWYPISMAPSLCLGDWDIWNRSKYYTLRTVLILCWKKSMDIGRQPRWHLWERDAKLGADWFVRSLEVIPWQLQLQVWCWCGELPLYGQAMPSWWLWKFIVQQLHVSMFHLAFFLQTSNEAMDLETLDSCRSEQWLTAVRQWKSYLRRGREMLLLWHTWVDCWKTTCGSICFQVSLTGFPT